MKKLTGIFLAVLTMLLFSAAVCEDSSDWNSRPVITKAYELTAGKLYLEWQGNAPVYQVYMDGKAVASVIVSNAVISVKKGSHTISIYPITETKSADTKVDVQINSVIFSGGLEIDLASLGLDPKKLSAGTPSDTLYIDYTVNPIFSAVPDKLAAETDYKNRVLLSFVDRHNADEYLITIKNGTDVNHVRFYTGAEETSSLISIQNSVVTVCLDQEYLRSQGCMVPELDEKYQFTVQLRKYAMDMVKGEKEKNVIHESKISGKLNYTPAAAWKTAPAITYASQTADGQLTIQWTHDDHQLGCEYVVLKIKKTLGIKTGEEVWATTSEKEIVFNDLMNGKYSFAVVPKYQEERGNRSSVISAEIENKWVVAPSLSCVQTEKNQISLTWPAAPGVTFYHITVSVGDSGSLLRFVNLDYSQYLELDIPASSGQMEYVFTYDGKTDPESEVKLKFEIYGVRLAENGREQKSAVSSQTIKMK